MLDWCYTCASRDLRSAKYKAFAYIWIQYARLIQSHMEYSFEESENNLMFTLPIKYIDNWDIDFYQKEKYNPKYWKFMKNILREYCADEMQYLLSKFKFEITDTGLKITARISHCS